MFLAPRLDTANETITDLLKFDLVFSRRVALMSLFLLTAGIYRRSFCYNWCSYGEQFFITEPYEFYHMVWITPQ